MNKRIEVPIWLVWIFAMSVGLNILVMGGLVVSLFTGAGVLSLVKPTLTPTATATATATALPTKTPLPTRVPTATPVPCKAGEVPGVDCPIDVGGLAVVVVSQERILVAYDSEGKETKPVDEDHIWLVIILALPPWTVADDLNPWFEDGYTHIPMIVDAAGNIYRMSGVWGEEVEGSIGMGLIFQVPKDASGLTLIIQSGDEVDLSLVPDITAAATETVPATPAATDTSEVP